MNIADQVGIVTGSASGLGRAMALGLARKGAKILIADIRGPEGKIVQGEIHSLGGKAEIFVGDISQEKNAQQMIESCIERFKRVDVLINNAGLRMEKHNDGVYESRRCLQMRPTHQLSVNDWDLVLSVNLRAAFLCTHFALPYMIRQKTGTIIGISSNAGSHGVAGKSAYCASKHAIEGLMKTVAEEVREYGISANAIHPGGRANVDGRGGESPEIIVPLALWLASQDRPAVTGRTISAREWNEGKVNLKE